MIAATIESRIRRFLLILAAFIFAGTLVELWLENHTKEAIQFLPFFLCGLGIITIGAALFRPSKATFRALRVAMTLTAAGGLLGMGFHLWNNYEFEREVRPNAAVGDLILRMLKGANPLLAPGILAFAALMVIIATYYHPVLGKRAKF